MRSRPKFAAEFSSISPLPTRSQRCARPMRWMYGRAASTSTRPARARSARCGRASHSRGPSTRRTGSGVGGHRRRRICAPISARAAGRALTFARLCAAGGTRGAASTFQCSSLIFTLSGGTSSNAHCRIRGCSLRARMHIGQGKSGSRATAPCRAGDSTHSKGSKDSTTAGQRRALGAERRSLSEHVQAVPVEDDRHQERHDPHGRRSAHQRMARFC